MKIHVVRNGETLSKVAEKYGVEREVLLAANPQIESQDALDVSTKIRIPSKGVQPLQETSEETSSRQETAVHYGLHHPVQVQQANTEFANPRGAFQEHEVRPGETLWKIAQEYNVGLPELLMANPHIEDPDRINVGDVIRIPPRAWHPHPMPDTPPMVAPGHVSPGFPSLPMAPSPMVPMGMGTPQMPMPSGTPHSPFPMTPYWHGLECDKEMKEGNWMPMTIWVPYTPHFQFPALSPHMASYSMP